MSLDTKDARGRTPLHTACDLMSLIPHFKSQNMSDSCKRQHQDVVALLIREGGVSERDSDGLTALDLVKDSTPLSLDVETDDGKFIISLRLKLLQVFIRPGW